MGVMSTALRVARAAGTVCVMRRAGACVTRTLMAVGTAAAAVLGIMVRSALLRVVRTARAAVGAAVTVMAGVCAMGTMRGRTVRRARRGGMVMGVTCGAAQIRRAVAAGCALQVVPVCAVLFTL